MEQYIEFVYEELLISRTDPRGVISYANEAFQRVSGYSDDALSGAPHKIVRHPDMPRGVFHLMWGELTAGNPVGAYVKNRAQDGRAYWVFAMVSPLEGGHISIRTRASAEGVEQAQGFYARMLERERDDGLSPEASAAYLVDLIRADGHQSYHTFMAERFVAEASMRAEQIGRDAVPQLEQLKAALAAWQGVGQRSSEIFESYKKFEVTPLNMKVEASHLGEAGAALGEIASNFAEIAKDVQKELQSFLTAASDDTETLYACLFQNFAQAIMAEASELATKNTSIQDGELQIIRRQSQEYSSRAAIGVNKVSEQLAAFIHGASRIKRQLLGLSVTRIMSAIEVARYGDDTRGNISAMVNDLRQFEIQTDGRMKDIEGCLHDMNANLRAIAPGAV
jgi:PAS domain S-box-containing protein